MYKRTCSRWLQVNQQCRWISWASAVRSNGRFKYSANELHGFTTDQLYNVDQSPVSLRLSIFKCHGYTYIKRITIFQWIVYCSTLLCTCKPYILYIFFILVWKNLLFFQTKLSYLMLTSSVNLRTRCGVGLRSKTPPPSRRRVDLLFRHAGRVELNMGIKIKIKKKHARKPKCKYKN